MTEIKKFEDWLGEYIVVFLGLWAVSILFFLSSFVYPTLLYLGWAILGALVTSTIILIIRELLE